MKKIALLATTLLLSATTYAQPQLLEIGSDVPMAKTKMESANGDAVTMDMVKRQNGLLVMFSCNTCPYVIKSQARTIEMMDYAKANDIGMIIINSNEARRKDDDSYKKMRKYAKEQGYTVPYVVDKNSFVADAFGATRTPEVFLFDKNGKLVYKGAMEDRPASPNESEEMFLKDAIDNMVSGNVIDPNHTKSIGCTIKRVM